jgi:anti-sigma factor RsiW
MSCTEVQIELVAYHFGEVEPELRSEIEQHLLGCKHCLAELLALKREIETAESDAAPSRAAHDRLRQAVELHLHPPRREWSWWERPLALLSAGAAVAAALFVLQVVSTSPGTAPHSLSRQPLPALTPTPTRVP